MSLHLLVFKDILRRKKRVFYAGLGIAVATMTVVGILTMATAGQARIVAQLEKYGANLSIIPSISNLDLTLGDLSLGSLTVGENYIPEATLPEIRRIVDGEIRQSLGIQDAVDIATISPHLYVNTPVEGVSVLAVGIEPVAARAIKTWWQIETGEFLQDGNQAVIGHKMAQLLKLDVGDEIHLNQTRVNVSGVLVETGSSDDYQMFVPIHTLQSAFDKTGQISSIDVRALCNACPVEVIADSLNRNIAGLRAVAVKQVAENEMGVMDKMNTLMLALAGITLVIGAFGVVNTMMTSVHERVKDIGIMRAVGASRGQIIRVFIYEAIVIGILGGLIGYLAGTGMAYGAGPLVFEGSKISYIPLYLPLALALAIIVAVVATSYPAFRATTIKVSDSFRSL